MESGGMFLLIDIIIAAYGAYLIYGAFNLRKNGEIGGAVWSKDLPMRKCKDKEGFIKYMFPRLLVSGILVLINGILGVLDDKMGLPLIISLIPMAIILFVVVWYIIFAKKAQKMYF